MKRAYRSSSRIVLDLLTAVRDEGPVGVTRLLLVANLTHAKLQELLVDFERNGWVTQTGTDRGQWTITENGTRALADLRAVDAVLRDHGLGL